MTEEPLKLYLAGPMSGLPESNYPAFHAAAAELRAAGYEVLNPAETDLPSDTPWIVFMAAGISQLATCDGIALLPGWQESKGARFEYYLAKHAKLKALTTTAWLWDKQRGAAHEKFMEL